MRAASINAFENQRLHRSKYNLCSAVIYSNSFTDSTGLTCSESWFGAIFWFHHIHWQ